MEVWVWCPVCERCYSSYQRRLAQGQACLPVCKLLGLVSENLVMVSRAPIGAAVSGDSAG